MSAPEADVRHKVQQWLTYADEDLWLVRHGLTITIAPPPYRLIAYHHPRSHSTSAGRSVIA